MQLIAAQLNGTHIGHRVTIHPSPVLSVTGKVREVMHVEDRANVGAIGATYVLMVGSIAQDEDDFSPYRGAYRLDPVAPVFVHTPFARPTPTREDTP